MLTRLLLILDLKDLDLKEIPHPNDIVRKIKPD